MKPDWQIVDNLPSDLWITCGQLEISHSEKDFSGRWRSVKEAVGALLGDCHRNAVWMTFQILKKSTLKLIPSMPLERIKTAIKGDVTSYPHQPLRNPLDRAVGGILVPTRSQSIPVHS
jgi:hypothetical protein